MVMESMRYNVLDTDRFVHMALSEKYFALKQKKPGKYLLKFFSTFLANSGTKERVLGPLT